LEIVEAVDLLIKEGINIELIFAGDGPLKKQIIQMAEIKSIDRQVRCLGKITNVNEFLDNIDLYVQFSKTEGIQRALLEAMSRGCLTVSSDVGGITELLPKSFLISSINPHELYLKIKEVLLDEELILSNLDNNYIIAKQNTVS